MIIRRVATRLKELGVRRDSLMPCKDWNGGIAGDGPKPAAESGEPDPFQNLGVGYRISFHWPKIESGVQRMWGTEDGHIL